MSGEILELLRCSQINFDNLVKMNPQVKAHPIYQIAREQLDQAVSAMEKRDERD